jgi:mannose-6-phosphate isomerase-like protein (cupin superfamily)
MTTQFVRQHKVTLLVALVAAGLAIGWATREVSHAQEKAGPRLVKSQTLTPADVKVQPADYEGKPTGKIAVYFDGSTATSRNFVSGRFELSPRAEPHPPHRHPEEEVLIVASGQGEIYCDGKTTKIGPGAMMFTGPNVEHGIKNTGDEPLVFYWVKWTGVGEGPGKPR